MKIAVTYDNGQIWQHFGKTEYYKLYEVTASKIIESRVVSTEGASHHGLADFLAANKVEAVICGGVGAPMIERLQGFGIKAYPGIVGDADQAVESLITGTLDVNTDAVHSGCHHQ